MIEARRHRTPVSRYHAGRIVQDGLHTGWFERVQPTYAAALDAFITALDTGQDPHPTLHDGLRAQAIAEAATRSLTTGTLEQIHY
jgi:myo-inositol 2-dehydrogenase/D-chiro-inositol 1-dehydrogenase